MAELALAPRPEEPPRKGVAEPLGFERFPLFDAARAIAVLLVLTIHATGQAGIGATGLGSVVSRFDVGVTIFFLISGFLLYRPFVVAHAEQRGQPSTGAYAWRRLLRIVPAYWLALTVAALVLQVEGVFTASGVPTYYGFAQIYDRDTFGGGLPQAWTLNVEIAFYAFLPLYALAVQWFTRRTANWLRVELCGTAVLVLAATAYKLVVVTAPHAGPAQPVELGYLPAYLDQFAVGMAMAIVSVWAVHRSELPRGLKQVDRHPALGWLIAIVSFVVVVRSDIPPFFRQLETTDAQLFERHWLYTLVAFGVLLPIAYGDPARGWIRRLLAHRAVLYIGTISYGIYLWHRPIIDKAAELGVDFGTGWPAYAAWTAFALACTAVVAALSWHVLELRLLRLKRHVPDRAERSGPLTKPPPQPSSMREPAG